VEPFSPFARLRAAAAALGLACALALLTAATAAATPSRSCRDQLCTGAVRVGTMPVSWASPELFYPNNEDLFAAVHVGPRPLPEVRAYGPALCRHQFAGSRINVVIKACTPETTLRVRATSRRKNTKLVTVSYAARPDIGGDMEQSATSATIYDSLIQITGLGADSSSGL
jgi:hypothetical protein